MKFDLRKPCADCPFLREGGIRLMSGRVRGIHAAVTSSPGATFACHKTTGVQSGRKAKKGEQHCAGALLYAFQLGGEVSQVVQVSERLGYLDASKLEGGSLVFRSLREWLRSALDREPPKNLSPAELREAVLRWAVRAVSDGGDLGTAGDCAEELGVSLRRVVAAAEDLTEEGKLDLKVGIQTYGAVSSLPRRDWCFEPLDEDGGPIDFGPVEFEQEDD